MQAADGVIVSSSLKRHGRRDQPIDPIRVSQFWKPRDESQAQSASGSNVCETAFLVNAFFLSRVGTAHH